MRRGVFVNQPAQDGRAMVLRVLPAAWWQGQPATRPGVNGQVSHGHGHRDCPWSLRVRNTDRYGAWASGA